MTDEAKAVEIARQIIKGPNREISKARVWELAQAFLALSEKCKKMQAVVEAAQRFWPYLPTVENKHSSMATLGIELRVALSELEPGDSDG